VKVMTANEWAHVTMRVLNLTTTTQAGARMLQVIEEAITKAIAEASGEKNCKTECCPICGAALDTAHRPFSAVGIGTKNVGNHPAIHHS
jgi:hypothetical protein